MLTGMCVASMILGKAPLRTLVFRGQTAACQRHEEGGSTGPKAGTETTV